ncbi:MAG: hypothetical protein GXO57_04735, partial [Thermodesulfobacteria bacterium]|nr:hypothetical protein [Thermodesulfobacteriota bacterium]
KDTLLRERQIFSMLNEELSHEALKRREEEIMAAFRFFKRQRSKRITD